jgi:pimeloyl-ACP methyl ester carboxylesterase
MYFFNRQNFINFYLAIKIPMTDKIISYQEINIYYRIYGKGKPIIFIHGFGEDGDVWQNQITFLQENFLVIVPDLPGSGRSSMLTGDNISIDDYATVIKTILQEEKIVTCAMIGHSMGGYITLAFAEKYPDMLDGFGLVHSSAFADNNTKIETRKKSIDFIKLHGSGAFLQTSIPTLFYNTVTSKKEIAYLIDKGSNFLLDSLVQYYEAMIARLDRTTVLKTFTKPILFIIGLHDQAILYNDSLQQTYLPSHAYINILRESAHMGMQEEKDKVNEILAQFLQ